MSFEAISWASRQTVGKSSAKFVLIAMANNADAQGFAWPSIAHICEVTEQDRKTVMAAIQMLRESGYLIETGEKKGTTKQVSVYRLSLEERASNSAENGTVKQSQKRNSPKNGTVPNLPGNSTVFPHKQSQKRDTEPSVTIKEPPTKYKRPDGVDEKLWADFLVIRKAKRAPVTETAIAGLRREAERAGMELNAAIATCCERGWAAFKAEWVQRDQGSFAKQKTQSAAEWLPPEIREAKGVEVLQ